MNVPLVYFKYKIHNSVIVSSYKNLLSPFPDYKTIIFTKIWLYFFNSEVFYFSDSFAHPLNVYYFTFIVYWCFSRISVVSNFDIIISSLFEMNSLIVFKIIRLLWVNPSWGINTVLLQSSEEVSIVTVLYPFSCFFLVKFHGLL